LENLHIWLRYLKEFNYKVFQLTRQEFENINSDLFTSIVEPIKAALTDCQLKPNDVDEIVLVGGSTRIPKIRQIVGKFFR
jgi:molecular chaperone DnaK (HSP70)